MVTEGQDQMLSKQITPLPTLDDISLWTASLPPVTLATQSEDDDFRRLIKYLKHGELPDNKQLARRTILQSDHYTIINDQLIRLATFRRKGRDVTQPVIKQLCLSPAWRIPIMAGFHDYLSPVNFEKVFYSIRDKYFLNNQFAEIQEFVQGCPTCQLARHRKRPDIELGTMPICSLLECVHIDLYGPVNVPSGPYKYVFSCVDAFSGYVEYIPAKSISAIETAKLLHERYFLRHGFVPRIISDRGSNFVSKFLAELFRLCKIKHQFTSSYHPNLNSPVEIRNKHLALGLRAHLMNAGANGTKPSPRYNLQRMCRINRILTSLRMP